MMTNSFKPGLKGRVKNLLKKTIALLSAISIFLTMNCWDAGVLSAAATCNYTIGNDGAIITNEGGADGVDLDLASTDYNDAAPPEELDEFLIGGPENDQLPGGDDLSDDGEELDLPGAEEEREYKYRVGKQSCVMLGEVTIETQMALDLDAIQWIGALDENLASLITIEKVKWDDGSVDYAIYPNTSFDRVELGITTKEGMCSVVLVDAVHAVETVKTQDNPQDNTPAAGDQTQSGNEIDETEPATDAVEGDTNKTEVGNQTAAENENETEVGNEKTVNEPAATEKTVEETTNGNEKKEEEESDSSDNKAAEVEAGGIEAGKSEEEIEEKANETQDKVDKSESETDGETEKAENEADEKSEDETEKPDNETESKIDKSEDESDGTKDEAVESENKTEKSDKETDASKDETEKSGDESDVTEDEAADKTENETDETEDKAAEKSEDEEKETENEEAGKSENKTDETENEADESDSETDETEDIENKTDVTKGGAEDEADETKDKAEGETEDKSENETEDEAGETKDKAEGETDETEDKSENETEGKADETEDRSENETEGETEGKADETKDKSENETEGETEGKADETEDKSEDETDETEDKSENETEGVTDETDGEADGSEDKAEDEAEGETEESETDETEGEAEAAGEEDGAEDIAKTYEATIDLSRIEQYPLSLRALLEGIPDDADAIVEESEQAEVDSDEGEAPQAVVAEILPASDWSIEFDEALLSINFDGEDYFITPLAGFEETRVSVENGKSYVLTFVSYTIEEQPTEEAEQAEPVAPKTYSAEIDLSEVDEYPLSLLALMDAAVPDADVEGQAEEVPAEPQSDQVYEDENGEDAGYIGETEASDEPMADAGDADGSGTEPEQAELPLADWNIGFDGALLSVEAVEDDYTVMPLEAFDRTVITVDNGSVYRLSLCNYAPKINYPEQYFEGSTETMMVSVYAPEGAFPENTTMVVADVADTETLDRIADAATGDVGEDEVVEVQTVHAVDITFFNAAGEEIEPLQPINVNMTLIEIEAAADQAPVVVHVDGEGEASVVEVEEQEASTDEAAATFTADTFSVYALVMTTLEKTITASDGNTYLISVTYGYDAQLPAGASLAVTEILQNSEEYADYRSETETALGWDEGMLGYIRLFDISIVDENWNEIPVQAPVSVRIEPTDRNDSEISVVHFGQVPEVMETQDDGATVSFETAGFSVYAIASTASVADLNGRSFSIMNYVKDMQVCGLQAKDWDPENKERKKGTKLIAEQILVRPNVVEMAGVDRLFLVEGTELSRWTFVSCNADSNKEFYITSDVGGTTKYLTMTNSKVYLSDSPDADWSILTVTAGSGEFEGKYRITNKDGYHLYLANKDNDAWEGFSTLNVGDNDKSKRNRTWMTLLEDTVYHDEDVRVYSAQKVDISDTANVTSDSVLIIYTRIWNEKKLEYDYYLVDHDGALVYCYDSGDDILWFGNDVNTAAWELTEYHYDNSTTTNDFYDLINEVYHGYLYPQYETEQITTDESTGIHLNGRRFGTAYSTILRYDPSDGYIGFKTENGRVVSCPMYEAEDFYFALIYNRPSSGELTTVDTLRNSDYGITMKMQDYPYQGYYTEDGYRSLMQRNVLGPADSKHDKDGIVSSKLVGEYPIASWSGTSLSALYSEAVDVDGLFIKSIHEESGYFEFDSTQNYAYLSKNPDDHGIYQFTVYDQLGTVDRAGKGSWRHGQFLPYNSLVGRNYTTYYYNSTDTTNGQLSEFDPRKFEKMYGIPGGTVNDHTPVQDYEADYFFGMEMSADFTQTESGLDAWGHDIIFEFSGDDDFWLFVDGILVLDLGGVHSALTGKINFRTGEVTGRGGKKMTLRDIYANQFLAEHQGATDQELQEYLYGKDGEDGIFKKNTTVFRDYSQHKLKVFYMERGASASNLHMRFNLTSTRPNQVVLHKDVTGPASKDYDFAKFPYQIYYRIQNDPTDVYRLLKNVDSNDKNTVTYLGKNTPVEYMASYKPEGATDAYESVFFLKSGESATIRLPSDTVDYYIMECGIADTYDVVKVNGIEVRGTDAGGGRKNYTTSKASPAARPGVTYNNHVDEDAVKALTITKKLFEPNGSTEITDDATPFTFRLYMGGEDEKLNDLAECYMKPYYVRNSSGEYCKWNSATKSYDSLGVSSFDELTKEQKGAARLSTLKDGTISNIPAGYTVEVRDLLPGVKFKVVEENVPKGYTFIEYERGSGSTIDQSKGEAANMGAIRKQESVNVIVKNKRGWGMTVKKVWSDADYMESHDPIYFAIYVADSLLQDSVRCLTSANTDNAISYHFDSLEDGRTFTDYVVREVTLTGNFSVDANGKVTGYQDVTPIDEGGSLEKIGGTPKGGSRQTGYRYTVSYQVKNGNDYNNVREYTVTNERSGISIYKQDMSGKAVQGAVFTLKDESEKDVGASSYTTDANGLITMAYLKAGTYTLEETGVPLGYNMLSAPVKVIIGDDNSISIEDLDQAFYTIDNTNAKIYIKNQPVSFVVKKVDEKGNAVEGAKFSLYAQVPSGSGLRPDYNPVSDEFENMETDKDGILAKVNMSLREGTYYLREVEPAYGFVELDEDLIFTIKAGEVPEILNTDTAKQQWLTCTEDKDTHELKCVLTIPNQPRKLQIKKISAADQTPLEGATFALYEDNDTNFPNGGDTLAENAQEVAGGTTGKDGLLEIKGQLHYGAYRLVETDAPDGFNRLEKPIKILISFDLTNGFEIKAGAGVNVSCETAADGSQIWTILIPNVPGVQLPNTGGPGTQRFFTCGAMMIIFAATMLFRKKRTEEY